jgi:cytochrome c-type biogenesis protein CcmH/NrfG
MNDRLAPENPLRLKSVRLALILLTALLGWLAPHCGFATVVPVAPATKLTVEAEFKALQARDEDARQDMSRWLRETAARDEHLSGKSPHLLSTRMEHRLQVVIATYAEFLAGHPNHTEAAMQQEVFRADITDDLEHIRRWEEARTNDPSSPAPWNELAHTLAHNGRTIDAFVCFEKSLDLSPREAVYFFDYATAMLLYRTVAMSHYQFAEPELFERVLTLYRRGMRLEPESFRLAADYAQTFYLVKPARAAEGLAAWEHAFRLTEEEAQQDEVRSHLARYAIHSGNLKLARVHLAQMTAPHLEPVKESLLRRIADAAKAGKSAAVPN